MRDNAIEIKGVSKFVDGKPIVYRVNLEVPKEHYTGSWDQMELGNQLR